MPIYEYRCLDCGEKFELRRGYSDNDQGIQCPGCHSINFKRVLSLFAAAKDTSGGAISPSCSPGSFSWGT